MWKALKIFGVLLLVAAAVFLALAWSPAPPLPEGMVPAPGTYDVQILRDTWGVPHIFGRRDADVAYGLAWAHAEDDFETIQGVLLAARGRLATLLGKDGAPNDYMVALLKVDEQVREGYPELSEEVREVCEAYAAGINHYAAAHPEEALSRLYPVQGMDLVRGFVHKLPLFFGMDQALRELFEGEPPSLSDLGGGEPLGSNAFALAPSRSAEGKTHLVVNSHQPWDGPVAWYEAHLKSEEGWDAVGGLFPGAPVVLHGHNRHLGWAHTVNKPDLVDVYALDVHPEEASQYQVDGVWHHFEEATVSLEVKLFGPFHWTVERPILASVHGPAVRRPDGSVYALRYAGMGDVGALEQWFRMNKARDFEEWRQAMAQLSIPMFNTVYADGSGQIFYVYNGRLPLRAAGYDWQGYLPGDTGQTLWQEHLPFDDLPQVHNPPSGFIQNCNNTPFMTTVGEGNPNPEDFEDELGIDRRMNNRTLRALALFGGDEEITADELLTYKYDVVFSPRSWIAQLRERAIALPASELPWVEEAREVLAAWDLGAEAENPHTALAILALGSWFDDDPASVTDRDLEEALSRAAGIMMEHHGRLEVPWGDVNRLRRGTGEGSVDLALAGAPDVLHAVYGEVKEDGRLGGVAGDSYILIAEWGEEGAVRSWSIHQYGSATQDSESDHYADQASLFARRELKPVWMDEGTIRKHLEREYRPGEP